MHSSMTLVKTIHGEDNARTIRSGGRGSLTSKHSWDAVCVQRPRYGKGLKESDICPTIEASRFEQKTHVAVGAVRGRNPDNPKSRVAGLPTEQMLELNENGTANTLTSVQKDNVVVELDTPYSMGNSKPGRSCLMTGRTPEVGTTEKSIRRLTEIECERLQGFEDDWTKQGLYLSKFYDNYIFGRRVQTAKKDRRKPRNKQIPLHRSDAIKQKQLQLAVTRTQLVVEEVPATQRYKCIGNAVTTDAVEAVGRSTLEVFQ